MDRIGKVFARLVDSLFFILLVFILKVNLYFERGDRVLGQVVISCGLILDIAGVVIIWKFGIPERNRGNFADVFLLEPEDPNEIKQEKQYDRLSKLGLSIILLGFVLQLIGNWLNVPLAT